MQGLHVLGRGLSLGRAQQGLPVRGQVLLVQALCAAQEGQSPCRVRSARPQDCQVVVGLQQPPCRLHQAGRKGRARAGSDLHAHRTARLLLASIGQRVSYTGLAAEFRLLTGGLQVVGLQRGVSVTMSFWGAVSGRRQTLLRPQTMRQMLDEMLTSSEAPSRVMQSQEFGSWQLGWVGLEMSKRGGVGVAELDQPQHADSLSYNSGRLRSCTPYTQGVHLC